MQSKVMLGLAVLLLLLFNYQIYQKETIRAHGTTGLLKLAPVDPRSLIQGDYMRLGYAIEDTISHKIRQAETHRLQDKGLGQVVIRLDQQNVGQFVRVYRGGKLGKGEWLLSFRYRYRQAYVMPDTFLFQEGHASCYEAAKYGVLKFSPGADPLLVGLADKAGKLLDCQD